MLTREARFVLLTAAGPGQLARPGQLGRLGLLLEQPLNWSRVVAIAVRERATAVLAERLRQVGGERVPPEVVETLRRAAMVASFRQLHLEERLATAVATLQGAGVRPLLLKGAALALTVYDSFESRPMGDLDLLVAADQADRAQRLLLERDWRPVPAERSGEFYQEHQHLPPLEDASGTGIRLEIHTDLFLRGHPFTTLVDSMWERPERVELGGLQVAVPSPTQLLLHLCLHFAWSHMMRAGAWRAFRDLHALEEHRSIAWASLPEAARAARAATSCYWTLRLARDLTGLPVPAGVLRRMAPPYAERTLGILARHVETGLLPTEHGCPSVQLSKWMWSAAIRPAASGHRHVRPWLRSAAAAQAFTPGPSDRGMDKLRTHLRQIPRWRDYLGTLFRRSDPPSPVVR